MKQLITAMEIKQMISAGKKVLYLTPGMLLTPSAKDACSEVGMTIEFGPAPAKKSCCQPTVAAPCSDGISPEMIAKIVGEVMAKMPGLITPSLMSKVVDPSGIALIKGQSVFCESFNTGNPNDKVGLTEIMTRKESPSMTTGFMTMDHSAFDWHLMYEEIDYVVEGTLDIIINGRTYRGQAGDVLYIPRDTKITFSTPDSCRFFFVTYPANWDELSGYQK